MAINFRLNDIGTAKSFITWRQLKHDVRGATAIEYGLLAGLVAVGLAGGLGALSDLVNLLFEMIGNETADVTSSMTNP